MIENDDPEVTRVAVQLIRDSVDTILAEVASRPLGFVLILWDSEGPEMRCISSGPEDWTNDMLLIAGQHAARDSGIVP